VGEADLNDIPVIDCVAIGLGMKSRLHIDNPGVGLDSGAGWAFFRQNSAKNPLSVVFCGRRFSLRTLDGIDGLGI
jgi:hypothetical protein